MKAIISIFAAVISAWGLCACHVDERRAPVDSVTAPDLGYFPVESRQVMQNNRMFLWRDGVTGGQAQAVMMSGQGLDNLEAEAVEIRAKALLAPGDRQRLAQIELDTEPLLFTVVENTDFYMNQPGSVAFFPAEGGGYGVTMYRWEFQTYSSVAGDVDDPAQRIRDVSYDAAGGTWRFKVYEPPRTFDVEADYFEFRVSRTRVWSQQPDGSLVPNEFGRSHEFYQGDITAYRGGIAVRRGVAKIMSSSSR